jgi:hypothetical protein
MKVPDLIPNMFSKDDLLDVEKENLEIQRLAASQAV